MAIKTYSITEALHAFDHAEPDDNGEVHVEAHWNVDAADALDLAGWYVDNIGVEPIEELPIQDWLAAQLYTLLGVDDGEDLAWQAAAEVAVQLGISEPDGVAYGDEGMVSDPYDLLHEAIEHTNGHPGQLFRDTAARLRN